MALCEPRKHFGDNRPSDRFYPLRRACSGLRRACDDDRAVPTVRTVVAATKPVASR